MALLLAAQNIYAVLAIYRSGIHSGAQVLEMRIFTRENCAQALLRCLPLALITALSMLLARLEGDPYAPKSQTDVRFLHRMLADRVASVPPEARAIRRSRVLRQVLVYALCLIELTPVVLYLARASSFPDDTERALSGLLTGALPWIALSAVTLYVGDRADEQALEAENTLLMKEPKLPQRRIRLVRRVPWYAYACVYALAAALIALGVHNGGLRDVLIKAIKICTECIGLG